MTMSSAIQRVGEHMYLMRTQLEFYRREYDDAAAKVNAVQAAIADYDAALARREHGDVAANRCVAQVRLALLAIAAQAEKRNP